MDDQFVFVPWKPKGWRDANVDLQIRSHCMKGRNSRPNSQRATRRARKALRQQPCEDAIEDPESIKDSVTGDPRNPDHSQLTVYNVGTPVVVSHEVSVLAQALKESPRQLLQHRECGCCSRQGSRRIADVESNNL
jgi:hypothetical protein